MQLFLDSADLEEIRQAASWGFIDGITTNPTLIAKSGQAFEPTIQQICQIIDGPVSAECIATERDAMFSEALKIAKLHPNVVVKIPLTLAGLQTVTQLYAQGIQTNVTLCFSAAQGLLAAKAGATYVSPFIGRLDDLAYDGMQVIREISEIYSKHKLTTRILAASIRHPRHVVDAALSGAHVATAPFKVMRQLVQHPLTDRGLEQFLSDWQQSQNKEANR